MNLSYLARIILRPVTFGKVKIVLFPALIAGVTLDWFIKYNYETGEVNAMSGSDGILIPILLIAVFLFLIVIDYYHYKRTQKFRNKILKLLSDPNIPETVKEQLARNFLQ